MSEANDRVRKWLTQPEGLATRMRALQAHAGLTGKGLAERLGWREYRVSRLLNGTKVPSLAEVDAICSACGANRDEAQELRALAAEAILKRSDFRARQKDGQADVQRDYNELVAKALRIRYFEVAYIPGFLQTPDYARRVFEEQVALHEGHNDVEAAIATRMERQRWLHEGDKVFEFLLTESCLRLVLPGAKAMRAQLDRLQTVIGLDRVRFGIIPFGVPLPITPQGPIQIYDDVAIVEDYLGENVHHDNAADKLGRVFDLLWDEAVEGDRVRQLIVAAQNAL